MPTDPRLVSSASPLPKRPKRIPANVKAAIQLMVRGRESDPTCQPLGMIEAAKEVGMDGYHLRKWLDRGEVRAMLFAERKAFRLAILGGNEAALLKVRDTSENGMATVAAVKALEQIEIDSKTAGKGGSSETRPGMIIQIINAPQSGSAPAARPTGITIDVTPGAAPAAIDRDETDEFDGPHDTASGGSDE